MAQKKKKVHKMDKLLIASKQQYEIYYISNKFQIPIVKVKEAIKFCGMGRSRFAVYDYLRKLGYTIVTKGNPKK